MQPVRDISLSIQFASRLSPWWLLLFIPLVLGAGYWLYRRQLKGLARLNAAALLVLRGGLLAGLVFLAFKPSLLWQEILTFHGRILLVMDSSGSMGVPDPHLPPAEALALARRSGLQPPDQWPPLAHVADHVLAVESVLRRTAKQIEPLSTDDNAYWDAIDKAQTTFGEHLTEIGNRLQDLAGVDALAAGLESFRGLLQGLFTGEKISASAMGEVHAVLHDLARQSRELMAAQDRAAIERGDPIAVELLATVRSTPRLALATGVARPLVERLQAQAPTQYVQWTTLDRREPTLWGEGMPPLRAVGTSPILERLATLARQEDDFPLTALILVSDGRETGEPAIDELSRDLSQRQVPLVAGGVGGMAEPPDLAIRQVIAPPFAVKGHEVHVQLRLKTALPEQVTVPLTIRRDDQVIVQQEMLLGQTPERTVTLSFTPQELGRFRYDVQVGTAPGEVVPEANNHTGFAMQVREERLRVLFLDWKPRWESRIALNILQRLDYLDLNAIIAIVQPDNTLLRGQQRGTWPQDYETLGLYDLILIGELPDGLLTADEWGDLARYVTEEGGTLAFIGGETRPSFPEALRDLLPIPLPEGVALANLTDLALTPAGTAHPLTRALEPHLRKAAMPAANHLLAESQPLLLDAPNGRPVLATRFAGRGKTLWMGTDRLWRRLHPAALDAHGELYLQMVNWAVDGGPEPETDAETPLIAVDAHIARTGDALQVWVRGSGVVEAVREDEVLGTATAEPVSELEQSIGRAAFDNLPPGPVVFRLAGDAPAATAAVHLLHHDRELDLLSRNEALLRQLGHGSGGAYSDLSTLHTLLPRLVPKERIERHERSWQLWDLGWVLAFLALMLTAEWIWRKFVGLV